MTGLYIKKTGGMLKLGRNTNVCGDVKSGILDKILKRNEGNGEIRTHIGIPESIISEIGTAYSENEEGFAIEITESGADVYAGTKRGILFGIYAIVSAMRNGEIECGLMYNYPKIRMRGIKVYLPARKNIEYFKRFIEFCSFCGCNTVFIEHGGAMQYERHPEINEGWEEYSKIFDEYQGKSLDVQRAYGWRKNSIHYENGGGSWLTKAEVRDLADFCKSLDMEVVPEVPCLSHCDYMLTRHHELAERQEDPIPNTYCPSNPDTYKLLFDIFDETAEVFEPNIIHIGHDEYYSIGLCDKCKGKDAAEIYADDINKIHDYLKKKNIKIMIWGDKILNAISPLGERHGGSFSEYTTEDGRTYTVPATYKAIEMIPKDTMIMNWYWCIKPEFDDDYFKNGLNDVVYGNFGSMGIKNYRECMLGKIGGYCISNWSSLDEAHIQRNGIYANVAYAEDMFWNPDFDENDFENNFKKVAGDIYNYHYNIEQNGKYAVAVHASKVEKPHKYFVDGYLMDYDSDYLGEYLVTYTDGSTQTHKVYFGLNIGPVDTRIDREDTYDRCTYDTLPYFTEPSYTCAYEEKDGKLFYKMPIPLDETKEVESIRLAKGEENIIVDRIMQ